MADLCRESGRGKGQSGSVIRTSSGSSMSAFVWNPSRRDSSIIREFSRSVIGSDLQLFRSRRDPSVSWIGIVPSRE